MEGKIKKILSLPTIWRYLLLSFLFIIVPFRPRMFTNVPLVFSLMSFSLLLSHFDRWQFHLPSDSGLTSGIFNLSYSPAFK